MPPRLDLCPLFLAGDLGLHLPGLRLPTVSHRPSLQPHFFVNLGLSSAKVELGMRLQLQLRGWLEIMEAPGALGASIIIYQ